MEYYWVCLVNISVFSRWGLVDFSSEIGVVFICDYTLSYITSSKNSVDLLSRLPVSKMTEEDQQDELTVNDYVNLICDSVCSYRL